MILNDDQRKAIAFVLSVAPTIGNAVADKHFATLRGMVDDSERPCGVCAYYHQLQEHEKPPPRIRDDGSKNEPPP